MPFCTNGCGFVVRVEDRHCSQCGAVQVAHKGTTKDSYVNSFGGVEGNLSRMAGMDNNNNHNNNNNNNAITSDIPCSICGGAMIGAEYNIDGKIACKECASGKYICSVCSQTCMRSYVIVNGKKLHRECAKEDIKCSRCNTLILTSDIIIAAGKNYHTSCYTCTSCNTKMTDSSFLVSPSGSVFCKKTDCALKAKSAITKTTSSINKKQDSEAAINQAKTESAQIHSKIQEGKSKCASCGELLTIDDVVVAIGDGSYHQSCVICDECGDALEEQYKQVNGKMYHPNCGPNPTSACKGCGKSISGKFIRFRDFKYHPTCLKCTNCSVSLTEGYSEIENKAYCVSCGTKRGNSSSSSKPVVAESHGGGKSAGFKIDPITGKKVIL